MGFLDNLGKTVNNAIQGETRKNEGNSDTSGVATRMSELRQHRDQAYRELGVRYVQLFGEAPAPELSSIVEEIRVLDTQISDCEKQQLALKGRVRCEQCGAEQDKTSVFCSSCGNRLTPEDAVLCPNCKSVLPEGAVFCTNCGTRIQTREQEELPSQKKTCVICGAVLSEDDVFCSECGAHVGENG